MAAAARRVYTPEDSAASAPAVGAARDIDDPVKFNKVLDQLPSVDVMLDNNWTLLVYACANGNVDAARTLLKRGANPDHVTKDCTSPLIAAATKGNVLLVDLLLEHNANVNVDAYGVTPLIAACANGRTAVVWKLLESDADVNLVGFTGDTSLMAAAGAGNLELTLLLVERGANVDYMNSKGFNALMRAAMHGHLGVVAALCRCGADPTLRGLQNQGFLPEEVALRSHHQAVHDFLVQWRTDHAWTFRRARLRRALRDNWPLVAVVGAAVATTVAILVLSPDARSRVAQLWQ